MHTLERVFTFLGVATARPWAFFVVAVYGVAWGLLSPATFGFHAVATLAVWLMTLMIQRAEHRDTQALHAKLDELLRVAPDAKSQLAEIDRREPEEIEDHRRLSRKRRRAPAGGG